MSWLGAELPERGAVKQGKYLFRSLINARRAPEGPS